MLRGGQDMVWFDCPLQFRKRPDIVRMDLRKEEIWMGRVRLLYRVRVQTDEDLRNQAADPDGDLHWSEVDLALI